MQSSQLSIDGKVTYGLLMKQNTQNIINIKNIFDRNKMIGKFYILIGENY
jgi:hypothetical protein